VPRFTLVTTDGESLGAVELGPQTADPTPQFQHASGRTLVMAVRGCYARDARHKWPARRFHLAAPKAVAARTIRPQQSRPEQVQADLRASLSALSSKPSPCARSRAGEEQIMKKSRLRSLPGKTGRRRTR
jgi:hypothetical protein